jgi:hypothetical protein
MVHEFHVTGAEKATLAVCAGLMWLLAAFVSAAAIASASGSLLAAALSGFAALALIGLACLIGAEATAAFRLRIALDGETLRLVLPRRRGHVALPEVGRAIPLASIAAIETRTEVFRQFGVAALQQVWRLRLTDGSAVVLGADRQMKPALFGAAAEAIAAWAKKPIVDLGMVDGDPGFLAIVGTSVPLWSAPSLPAEEMDRRRIAAARAFQILTASITLFMIARLIARR